MSISLASADITKFVSQGMQVSGENISKGNIVTYDPTDSKMYIVNPTHSIRNKIRGVAIANANLGNEVPFVTFPGEIKLVDAFQPGVAYIPTSAGDLIELTPNNTDYFNLFGYAKDKDTLLVDIHNSREILTYDEPGDSLLLDRGVAGGYTKRTWSEDLGTKDFTLEVTISSGHGIMFISFIDFTDVQTNNNSSTHRFYFHSNGGGTWFRSSGSWSGPSTLESSGGFHNLPLTMVKTGDHYEMFMDGISKSDITTPGITSHIINVGGFQTQTLDKIRIKIDGYWQKVPWTGFESVLKTYN